MKNFKKKYLEEKARRLSVNQVEETRADFYSQNKCLYCYEAIDQKKSDFHDKTSIACKGLLRFCTKKSFFCT